MERLFKYLDRAIKEVYKEDKNILKTQSLNSLVFRLGVYLNNLLKRDFIYRDYYVDYNFKDKDIDYLDLVIHNRIDHKDLIVIKITKDESNIKDDLGSIKLITEDIDELSKSGVLIVLGNEYYNSYKLSPRYYDDSND